MAALYGLCEPDVRPRRHQRWPSAKLRAASCAWPGELVPEHWGGWLLQPVGARREPVAHAAARLDPILSRAKRLTQVADVYTDQ